jgi:hypothetical protein
MKTTRNFNQHGLTMIEVLIAVTTTSLLVVTFSAFLMNYWQYSIYQQADLDSLVQRLNTSDYFRENLGTSTGLITQNSHPDINVGFKDPIDSTDSYWNPLHAVPGVINNGQDGDITPVLYYTRLATDSLNNVLFNGAVPYEDEHIVYLDNQDKSLKVRTVIDPVTLGTNKKITSCPKTIASPACPEDTVLINGVSSVDRRFFSRSGNLIDWTSVYDADINQFVGPDNGVVEVVELKINVASKAIFQKSDTTQNSTIIRVALRNR